MRQALLLALILLGICTAGQAHAQASKDGATPDKKSEDSQLQAGAVRAQFQLQIPEDNKFAFGVRATAAIFVLPLVRNSLDRDRRLSLSLEMLTFETAQTDQNSRADNFLDALRGGLRYDSDLWGVQAGVQLLAIRFDELYLFSPIVAFRAGDPDVVQAAAQVELPGLFGLSTGDDPSTFRENFRISMAVTAPVGPSFQLQGRMRVRDMQERRGDGQGVDYRLQDIMMTVGVEGAFDVGLKLMPTYLGFGIRQVIDHSEAVFFPVDGGRFEIEARGKQFVVVLETLVGVTSGSMIW